MATTFDCFRCPPQFSEFIPYPGPQKSKTARRRTFKEAEPSTDEWRELEVFLGNVPEHLEALRVEGVATS